MHTCRVCWFGSMRAGKCVCVCVCVSFVCVCVCFSCCASLRFARHCKCRKFTMISNKTRHPNEERVSRRGCGCCLCSLVCLASRCSPLGLQSLLFPAQKKGAATTMYARAECVSTGEDQRAGGMHVRAEFFQKTKNKNKHKGTTRRAAKQGQ